MKEQLFSFYYKKKEREGESKRNKTRALLLFSLYFSETL
jgi:hypothetical protein